MIDKILERFREASRKDIFDKQDYILLRDANKIVQEVAKEYGKDTNVPSNGWIPVETELPKEHAWAGHVKSEDVFVTFLDNGGKARVNTDNTYDGKWHYYGDRVIAWMPKKSPDPYQKGE